jgi:DNA polymerase III delta prime subunit
MEMVKKQSIPHILLSGIQGTGKTTLALLLINEMKLDPTDVLMINASDENNVETVRDKISSFVKTTAMGNFKIVLLEEGDYFNTYAQGILRHTMEQYSENARFILTCNYAHRIIPAIRSRFTAKFQFKASDKDDMAEYLVKVLVAENVKFDLDVVDQYIEQLYPDTRDMLGAMQVYTINGVLQPPPNNLTSANDYQLQLIECIEKDNWSGARELVCANVQREEYEDMYRFLYDNISISKKFQDKDKWDEAIVTIADHLGNHPNYSDAEINAAAMFIKLGAI